MQAVADRLGVDRSALHYHVADRAALLELVAQHAFADYLRPTGIDASTSWQDGCRCLARATRESVLATGQFAFYLRLPPAPETLRPAELVLERLTEAGFSLEAAARAIYTVSGLALWLAIGELSAKMGEHPAIGETGRALAAEPSANPLLESLAQMDSEFFNEAGFSHAVDTFILGLEARLAAGEQ
jgi:AcrR family transcriptional regulator